MTEKEHGWRGCGAESRLSRGLDPGPALHSDPSSVLPARVCRTPRYAGSIWGDQQAQRQLNFSLNRMTFDSAAFLLVRGMRTASPGRSGTHERNLSPIFPVEKLGQRVPIPMPSLLATPSPSLLSLWISKKNPDLNEEELASAAHSLCRAWDQGRAEPLPRS